ncbi:membrane-associated protein, putative [Bodo saltans]|uniref:Membrane-associated protein, putative n=1 Tax=Bodo saltans TaxID=75058 RepID=A0A0S4ISX9_BODSA|nr:membrane-associated protein, putative [Bodo saltans]|eukprot:CUE95827.1 membrane-associated protein, putative [Bodo saltans]
MSLSRRCAASLLLCTVVLLLMMIPVDAFSEELIRCKVCQRAVSHVWGRGVALMHHCKTTRGADRDRRCDFHDIHPHAIDQMVWGVCDALPTTYQAIHESEFDLVLHEDPQHSDELAKLIISTCSKFVHDHHGVEVLGDKIHRHLQHSIPHERHVTIAEDVCSHVCAAKKVEAKKHAFGRKTKWEPVQDHDEGEF